MRIGILTFCDAYNLGGALQAYSLQKKLEAMGHDCELIVYHCPAIDAMHRLRPVFQPGIPWKARIYNVVNNTVFFPRRIGYRRFQRCEKRSIPYDRDTIEQADGKYDLFITGSDQVFNLKLTGEDTTYFLDFVKKSTKAAYAASLGTYLPDKKAQYQQVLQSFAHLTVREKSTVLLLEKEMGIHADVMPDPVFLHTAGQWKALLGIEERKHRRKYLLIYALFETKELYRVARELAQEHDLRIVAITKVLRPMGRADRYLRNTGPKEFVDLVANADYVVTNSFHGTALSLVFEKQFTALLPPIAPERIVDLLTDLGIGDRAILHPEAIPRDPIDYSEVTTAISEMRESAVSRLKKFTQSTKHKK